MFIDELQASLDRLEHQNGQLDLEISETRRQYSQFQQQLSMKEREVEDLREQGSRYKSQLDEMNAILKTRAGEIKEREKMVEEFKKKYQDASEVIRNMERSEKVDGMSWRLFLSLLRVPQVMFLAWREKYLSSKLNLSYLALRLMITRARLPLRKTRFRWPILFDV